MKATIKHWVQQGAHDIGNYKTTVTLVCVGATLAVTFDGRHRRKEVLGKLFHHLVAERRWSPQFLAEAKELAGGRRKKS